MKRLILVALVFALLGLAAVASAQTPSSPPVTMLTSQKVEITISGLTAENSPSPLPQSQTMIQTATDCNSCTFTGLSYDAPSKTYKVWFNAGTEFGAFTVTVNVTVGTTTRVATLTFQINEPIVIPAAVKLTAATPVPK